MRTMLAAVMAVAMLASGSVAAPAAKATNTLASKPDANGWIRCKVDVRGEPAGVVCCPKGRVVVSFDYDLFTSDDEGKTWKQNPIPDKGQYAQSYCMAVNSKGVVFLGTSGGLYRSTDGGDHWRYVAWSFAPGSMFVGKKDRLYVSQGGGVVSYSDDNGEHWKKITTEWKHSAMADSVAVNSKGDVFLTCEYEVYRYDKAGGWVEVNTGRRKQDWTKEDVSWVQMLHVDKNGRMFAGVHNNMNPDLEHLTRVSTGEAPLLMSADDGAHWSALSLDPDCRGANSIAFGPNDEIVVGTGNGVFVSWDDGKNWRRTSPPDALVRGLYDWIHLVAVDVRGHVFAVGPSEIIAGSISGNANGKV